MTDPQRDRIPEVLDELDRSLEGLAREFHSLRRRLESLADEIRIERGLQPKGTQVRPAPASAPLPAGPMPPPQAPVREPKPPTASRINKRFNINPTTIIAAIGGAVLLIGVGLFLVMAAQAGLFGPVARVVTAAVAAVALVAGGLWLQLSPASPHRKSHDVPPGVIGPLSPGALALIGVGFAAGVLDVLAATVLYEWLPAPFGFLVVGLLALGGLLLARWWRSDFLAAMFSLGAMVVAPGIGFEVETTAFIVVIAILTAALCLERGPAVRYIRSVTPALALFVYAVFTLPWSEDPSRAAAGMPWSSELGLLVILALALAVVGVVVALIESHLLGIRDKSVVLAVIITGLPIGLASSHNGFWAYLPLVAAIAYFAGALAVGGLRPPTRDQRNSPLSLAFGVTALFLIPTFLLSTLDGEAIGYGIVALAIIMVLASWLDQQPWVRIGAGLSVFVAALTWIGILRPAVTLYQSHAVATYGGSHAGFALLATLLALLVVAWIYSGSWARKSLWLLLAAAAALLTLSVTIIVIGVSLGNALGDPELWFQLGHLLTTTLWISLAAYLILSATSRVHEPRKVGFVLVGLAVAKLFIVDLATLPGIIRVVAFVLVGATLITVAVVSGSRKAGYDDPARSGGPDSGGAPGGSNYSPTGRAASADSALSTESR